jgi:hypothetical protein
VSPVNLNAVAKSPTTVELSWDAQERLKGYKLEYKKTSDSGWTEVTTAPGATATSVTVSRLTADTEYQFRLTAFNAAGDASAEATAKTLVNKPKVPTGFKVTETTANSVTLTWDEQSGLDSYKLQYKKTSDANWTDWTPPGASATTATITGLGSGTTYQFRLTAVNVSGEASATTSATTQGDSATDITAQVGFKATATSSSSVTLSWTVPAGFAVTRYTLQYKKASDANWTTGQAPATSATSATVTGLAANTAYTFRLSAVTAAGSGFAQANATTQDDSSTDITAQDNFKATATSSSSVALSWTVPASFTVTRYTLQYKKASDANWTTGQAPATSATSATVTGLEANTAYTFRLSAVTASGSGFAQANATTAKGTPTDPTNPTTPTAPDYFRVTAQTANSMALAWIPQSGLTGYTLEYKKASSDEWWTWATLSASASSAAISGLDGGTAYDVRLTAVNGTEKAVAAMTVTTNPAVDADANPNNGQVQLVAGQETTRVLVTWQAVKQNTAAKLRNYVVEYRVAGTTNKWKSVTVKTSTTVQAGTPLNKVLKLKAGTAYEIKVHLKAARGEYKGVVETPFYSATIKTRSIVPKASLATVKGSILPNQVALQVKNLVGNSAIGTAKKSVAVDTLTVVYSDKYYGATVVHLTCYGGSWTVNDSELASSVSFTDGVLVIKGLRPQTKYTVSVQFSNQRLGQEAVSKSATRKAVSTAKI